MFVISIFAGLYPVFVGLSQNGLSPASSSRATKAMQLDGTNLFVAAWGYGVQVLDVSDPLQPKWKGGWNPRRCPMCVQVVGNFAFVADRIAGLTVLDVSDSANPVWVSTVDTPGDAFAVHVVGKIAYVADSRNSGLLIFDVSNPREPRLITRCETAYGARGVQVAGTTAYVNCGNQIQLINISDVEKPFIYSSFDTQFISEYSEVVGALNFTCGGNIFKAKSNRLIGKYPGGSSSVFVQGENLFASTHTGSFSIVNVSNPAEPKLISSLELGTKQQIDIVAGNDVAYVMDQAANIQVIDVKNTSSPKLVTIFSSTHYSSKVLSLASTGTPVSKTSPATVKHSSNKTSRSVAAVPAESIHSGVAKISPAGEPVIATSIIDAPPELRAAEKAGDGTFSFILVGVPESMYVIQVSSDLNSWTSMSTNTLPSGGSVRIVDSEASTLSQRYYRAVIQP
jgi:hypothetical protein